MHNGSSIGRGWFGRTLSLPLSSFFVCLSFFSFFGFLVTHTDRTGGPILTTYAPYDVFLGKDVPLGAVSSQTKTAKYENLYIIKTTAPISTKFCKPIETTKYSMVTPNEGSGSHQFGETVHISEVMA